MVDTSFSPESFERQVERIHKLIEDEDSTVTWNDRIPDPDNQQQPRQIDVSIFRDDALTLVECRLHKVAQGLKWIEELIGRRLSLEADAVIAVSSSGFTKGAVKKAKKYGVILRHLHQITDNEVQSWGLKTSVSITFYEFTDFTVTFELDASTSTINTPIRITGANGKPFSWRPLFETLMQEMADLDGLEAGAKINSTLIAQGLLVDGNETKEVGFKGRVKKVVQGHNLASIVIYQPPYRLDSSVYVEKHQDSEFEIIQQGDKVAAIADLSTIKIPDNFLFHTLNFDFGRKITLTNIDFIGIEQSMAFNFNTFGNIEIKF